jgi:uncharacterized protein
MRTTREAARRFLVARHFLAPARSLQGGGSGVLEIMSKLGSIQFDPLAIAGRNQNLMLHARVADYDPAWCDVLYERREMRDALRAYLRFTGHARLQWSSHLGRERRLFLARP